MEQNDNQDVVASEKKLEKKALLAEMTTKQKVEYILQYYIWHIIGFVALVIGLIVIVKTVYTSTMPTVLSIGFVNNNSTASLQDYVKDSYREYYDLDTKNHINVHLDLDKSNDGETALADDASLEEELAYQMQSPAEQAMAYATTVTVLDAMICDEEALELYMSAEETTAIDSVLPDELYKKVEDKIVIGADPNKVKFGGEPYSVAIDVSDTEFIKNCNLSYDKAYLVIPATRKMNDENTVNFVKFIFGF